MFRSSIEIDSNSDDEYPTVTTADSRELDQELDVNNIHWIRPLPTDYTLAQIAPITDIKAQRVQNECEKMGPALARRYKQLKPLWLKAEIKTCHIGSGEETGVSIPLRDIIRARGIDSDQCGHIIGNSVGGKMVDINLFPQNEKINCGLEGNYNLWKVIDASIKMWVQGIPEDYNPRVEFQMLLYYGDPKHPKRPDRFKYMVEYLKDTESSLCSDDNDENWISVSNTLFNIACIALQCKNNGVETVKKDIKKAIKKMSRISKPYAETFLKEWLAIFPRENPPKPVTAPRQSPTRVPSYTFSIDKSYTPEVPNSPAQAPKSVPALGPPNRDRKTTIVDFIPVVGAVKTLKEGAEDLDDGNTTDGVIKLAVGAASLGLDVMTLGSAGGIVNGAGKVVAKEVAKTAAIYAASNAVKLAGKNIPPKSGSLLSSSNISTVSDHQDVNEFRSSSSYTTTSTFTRTSTYTSTPTFTPTVNRTSSDTDTTMGSTLLSFFRKSTSKANSK